MARRSSWYTIGYDELRFRERSGPPIEAAQIQFLSKCEDQWNWAPFRRQALSAGSAPNSFVAYEKTIASMTAAQADRIIDEVIERRREQRKADRIRTATKGLFQGLTELFVGFRQDVDA